MTTRNRDRDRAVTQMLELVATITSFSANTKVLAFYVQALDQVEDTDRLLAALGELAKTTKRFPTVGEILHAAGETPMTADQVAREIADRLWRGIAKFGYMETTARMPEIEAFLGPIGWDLVQSLGGWNYLCHTTMHDMQQSIKAQWRESAIAMIARHARGQATGRKALAPTYEDTKLGVRKGGLRLIGEIKE